MSNILLLCASGVTSSLLAQKLNRIVENDLNGYNLITCSICDVATYADDTSIMLLTPQVRFNYDKIQQMYSDKHVLKIDNKDYKQLNIDNILEMIKNQIY